MEMQPEEGSRGKVMGILAIVLAGIATFIPFLGVYLTVVAAVLAAFSYGKSALFGYIAIGINFLSLFFFSPITILFCNSEEPPSDVDSVSVDTV